MENVNEQMNIEIQEAIKKSLPQQVGEALKQRLEQADKDSKEIKELKNTIAKIQGERITLQSKVTEYEKLDERNLKLTERENLVSQQERELKLTIADLKLAEAEKRNVDMVNLTALVFKSPVYKTYIQESKNGHTAWNNQTNSNQFVPSDGLSTKSIEKKQD
jgi:hypothetical protein